MSCRLRSYDGPLPGNYSYVQTEGIKREFPAVPVIESLAQDLSGFRKGNGLPRSSVKECLLDVDHYNAQRLGCHRDYTMPIDSIADSGKTSLPQSHPIITPCRGCGAQLLGPT